MRKKLQICVVCSSSLTVKTDKSKVYPTIVFAADQASKGFKVIKAWIIYLTSSQFEILYP